MINLNGEKGCIKVKNGVIYAIDKPEQKQDSEPKFEKLISLIIYI